MSTLGKAIITFGADTATFSGDVGRAVAVFERGMGRMQGALRGLDGPLSRLAGGLSIAGASLFVKNVIDSADELGKLSQKVGISTEKLSEYRLAAELGDVSNEQFAKGLRAFNVSLVEASNNSSKASKVFKALGVDVAAGPAEAFKQFAQQMSTLPDSELKTAAAMEILKKAGADWIPTLNGGKKGLEEAAEKARALGLVISTQFARQAEQFNDNMKLLSKGSVSLVNSVLSGGMLEVFVKISDNIAKASEKGERWLQIWREIQKVGRASIRNISGDPTIQANQDLELWRLDNPQFKNGSPGQVAGGRIRGLPVAAAAETTETDEQKAERQRKLREALAMNEGEVKRYVSALRSLEKQLGSLNDETALETMTFELFGKNMVTADGRTIHLEGSLEQLTAAHKKNLLAVATQVTGRQNLIKISELALPALQAEADMVERAAENYTAFFMAGREADKELAFQIGLLTMTSREQEKANALHQIDLELLRRKQDLARIVGDDTVRFATESAKLEAQAEDQRKRAIAGIQERQRVEQDWSTGTKRALDDYVNNSANAAEQANRLWGNAFRGMEDALVDFVKTGKVDFKSLANSIIDDLIRIQVQNTITKPLGQALSSGGGGLFDLILNRGGAGGFAKSAGAAVGGDAWFAGGGVMTARGPLPLKSYSSGGVANSAQVAVFGEGMGNEAFVPLPDGRRIPVDMGGGRGRGAPQSHIAPRSAARAGMDNLLAYIRSVDGSVEERAIVATASRKRRGGAYRALMG